ncbi:hypothetical protein IW143_001611 [Coemansia sp. RSA 520]|nr:hypothetical protein IW143_001611 [Coemansia sp. RSA 520]
MTLGLKRPRPGSKCVDEPATKKVMIDPYEDLTDPSEQELNIILTNYPGRRPAITSGMKKLALALYAKPPDVSSITKLSNVPPHARAPTQPAAPNVVAGHTVTLKDISKAKGRGEAVMNLVQAFEYVLWVAKWEVALRRNFPERERLFMEMLPVVDIANGQHKGQTIIDLNRALGLQASNAKEFDKVVKDMMGGEIVGKAREDFNRQLATARVFVYTALIGRGKFDRICCQSMKKSTLRSQLDKVMVDYKFFQYVVNKANIDYVCTDLNIKDAQGWGAVCDIACFTGSNLFVNAVKQDKAVEKMMDTFVKSLL